MIKAEIVNADQVPKSIMGRKLTRTKEVPDMRLISKLLREGFAIPGTRLINTETGEVLCGDTEIAPDAPEVE